MTILRSSKASLFFALVVAVVFAIQGDADTLFNGKNPVKIGHGSQSGKNIAWTDCDGKNEKTYANPPFSMREADNCSVRPSTFGLACNGDECTVVDELKIQDYLPTAERGDKVTLRVTSSSVELRHKGEVMQLGR